MVEGATFSNLVREAFIVPLRSVLIVDDQYPTWEEILNSAMVEAVKDAEIVSRSAIKQWRGEPNGPLEVIKQFRNGNPGFVIDIHDAVPASGLSTLEASEPPAALASHLHQSDLLVLDYNLEGDSSGLGGAMARDILQSVLANNHFNLIVVHTGEDNLDKVLFDCLLSLMSCCSSDFDSNLLVRIAKLDQKLQELLDDEKFDKQQLPQHFDIREYIECRRRDIDQKKLFAEYMKCGGVLASLGQWANDLGLVGGERRVFLYWAIREFEKTKSSLFSENTHDGLNWKNSPRCKWLRTGRGFVVFVEKGAEDLLAELLRALEDWAPTPSRLLSAKYRHEFNRIGVEVEDRTLSKSHVFAHFYNDICDPGSHEYGEEAKGRVRIAKLKDHVSRQSEAISFHIEDKIAEFGERIVSVDTDNGNNFIGSYGVDLTDAAEARKAVSHYNSYISTLPLKVGVDQLDSGHVFQLDTEWYVCATPACDLQPDQTSIAFGGSSDELKPFTALLLKKVDIQDLSAPHINSGAYCFVESPPGEIVGLGLRLLSEDGKPTNEKVTWRTFLAMKNGLIENDKFEILRPKLNGAALESELMEAQVIAKLRYEYALNYIQKVGASVSRIGLGYAAVRE